MPPKRWALFLGRGLGWSRTGGARRPPKKKIKGCRGQRLVVGGPLTAHLRVRGGKAKEEERLLYSPQKDFLFWTWKRRAQGPSMPKKRLRLTFSPFVLSVRDEEMLHFSGQFVPDPIFHLRPFPPPPPPSYSHASSHPIAAAAAPFFSSLFLLPPFS